VASLLNEKPAGLVVRALVVVLLLVAGVADAEPVKPPFTRHLPGTAAGLVAKEDLHASKAWFDEWRQEAGRFAERVWHAGKMRQGGEPLDMPGLQCVLWTKMAELIEESRTVLSRRYEARGAPLPQWIQTAHTRARENAKEACSSRGDGDGGLRPENLGLVYLRWWEKLHRDDPARREAVAADAAALQAFMKLAAMAEAYAPAVGGGLAPAGLGLPFVNPCLLQPSLCKDEVPRG